MILLAYPKTRLNTATWRSHPPRPAVLRGARPPRVDARVDAKVRRENASVPFSSPLFPLLLTLGLGTLRADYRASHPGTK